MTANQNQHWLDAGNVRLHVSHLADIEGAPGKVVMGLWVDNGHLTAWIEPEKAARLGEILIARYMHLREPARFPLRRCETCDTQTPHDGRICMVCGAECCMPEDGELCPHCAESAALDAQERAGA